MAPISSSFTSGIRRHSLPALGRRRAAGADSSCCFTTRIIARSRAPQELAAFDLDGYDGVLAFGEVLRRDLCQTWLGAACIYLARSGRHRTVSPDARDARKQDDLVWIGNWGDDERSPELDEFLIRPLGQLKLSGRHLRCPISGTGSCRPSKHAGLNYGGWLPNHLAPMAFARARATVHVPRGPYAQAVAGHPDHSHLRSTGLRHSPDFSPLVRRRAFVSAGLLFEREQWARL